MKYWTGYLAAAIIGAISWALLKLAEKYTQLVDMIYPYITRNLQSVLATWSSGVDFCLWQVAVVLFAVVLVAFVVVIITMKWNPIRWAGWLLALCSAVYLLHTLTFGLNYHAGALADDIRMEQRDYSLEELANATSYYRDRANLLAVQMNRDSAGQLIYADFDTLANMAEAGFDSLVHDYHFPVFAGSKLPVKKLRWANMYSPLGITGVTMGITGEAAVNPQIPGVSLPFTMCHEMAHRMSIARESDANFAAFLASMANADKQYQYSAYFMAYRYCYNAMVQIGTLDANAAAAKIAAQNCPELQRDIAAYNDFFSSKRNDAATNVANTVNDTYLKTSGDSEGIASYGRVSDLLVNWHYKTIVLPALTEQQNPFDPLDENQVDLSDNPNSREPVATEPPAAGGVG